jgi:hypothetical protein
MASSSVHVCRKTQTPYFVCENPDASFDDDTLGDSLTAKAETANISEGPTFVGVDCAGEDCDLPFNSVFVRVDFAGFVFSASAAFDPVFVGVDVAAVIGVHFGTVSKVLT